MFEVLVPEKSQEKGTAPRFYNLTPPNQPNRPTHPGSTALHG